MFFKRSQYFAKSEAGVLINSVLGQNTACIRAIIDTSHLPFFTLIVND